MRSFSEYLKHRNSTTVYEMAAPSQEYVNSKGEKVVKDEVRRTPVFMDQDDINYLYQFPPMFWKQALRIRYGELLQQSYETKEKGQRIPDRQDITISLSGGGRATFEVETGINNLLDKLTHDVDNNKYRKLGLKDKDAYLQHAREVKEKEGRDLGSYGFVLSGFASGKGLRAAKGFVAPDDSTIKEALRKWYDSISEGWFDSEIDEDHRVEDVKIGLGGRGKKISKKFKVFPDIKKWVSKQNKVYESYLPILRPAIMVKASDSNSVSVARQAVKQIDLDLKTDNGINQYFQILDFKSPNLLNMDKLSQIVARMTQIEKTLESSKADTDENDSLKKELANIQKLAICAEVIGGINLGIRGKNIRKISTGAVNPIRGNMKLTPVGEKLKSLLAKASRSDNPEQQIISVIKSFIGRLRRLFEFRAQSVLSNAERHDIHDWNALHSQGKNPYTGWVGFGTINPNWQQKEVHHAPLQDNIGSEKINEFWNHLLVDLNLQKSVSVGVDLKIRSVIGDKIKNAIRQALIDNRDAVISQASDYFKYIGAKGPIMNYSDLYKKMLSGEKLSSEESAMKANVIEDMKKFAARQGNNFTGSLSQLHYRFKHPERWNRALRSANPTELQTANSSPFTMEEIFKNFYDLHSDTHPDTSHAIEVLLARIAENPDSELEIDESSSDIPMTDENKELSRNIIATVAAYMSKSFGNVGRLLGLGKSGQPQQGQPQQGQPQQGQPQQGQPQQGQPQQGQPQQGQPPAKRGSFLDMMNFMKRKKDQAESN